MFKWEGHSEVDKYALSVYEKHFPESEALGDIRLIRNTKGLPEKLDLVTFGFPCQDLSIAGKRGGITASRSGLFTKAMRIIRAKKPSYIIFENVKGLFSSNEGKDLDFVLRTVARAGYVGQWQLLNTRWFLPQNRERIYFVGHLRGKPRPQIFPIGESSTGVDEGATESASVRTLTAGGHSGGHHSGMTLLKDNPAKGPGDICGTIRTGGRNRNTKKHAWDLVDTKKNSQGDRVNSVDGDAVTLNSSSGGKGHKTGLYQVPIGYNKGGIKEECGAISSSAFEHNNFVVPLTEARTDEAKEERRENIKNGKDYSARRGKKLVPREDDTANTISTSTQDKEKLLLSVGPKGTGVRRLTPMECERLQGFPDNYTAWANRKNPPEGVSDLVDMISDSQRYKMMGNTVSIPVVKAVIMGLLANGVKIETYLDLFSGVGGFRLGIEEAINEYNRT